MPKFKFVHHCEPFTEKQLGVKQSLTQKKKIASAFKKNVKPRDDVSVAICGICGKNMNEFFVP